MATNRRRIKRIPKGKIPQKISKAYREKERFRDYMGRLQSNEIQVAAKAGVLRWDLWQKSQKVATLTGDLHRKNWRLAPIFDGHGDLDYGRYDPGTRFLVEDYKDLKIKQAEK